MRSWKRSLIEFTKIIRGRDHLQRLLQPLRPELQRKALLIGMPGIPRQRSANVSA